MTDPSNPDLVEQLAEKYSCYHTGVPCECAPIDYKAAIREAISVTRRETLEHNARIADTWKLLLPGVTLDVDPEEAGNQVADAIAAEIRRIGENK